MFQKAAVFTDLHMGMKNNSLSHTNDCEEFIDWYIENAQENNCETGIFCGDFFHIRNNINVSTLDAATRAYEKLGKAFKKFYMFPGNHDLYYKHRRDVTSIEYAKHIPGITFVNEILKKDDVCLVPWLVGDEWTKIKNIKESYVFGHFELPNFFMNSKVKMPDHNELQIKDFEKQQYVFSGHFHKRQYQNNIHYIGNAFPHNYADAWDDERGMMILEKGGTPEYLNWENCPKYRTTTLSELIDKKDTLIKSKTYLRVTLDLDITFEEASFIKETFMNDYECREISLINSKNFEELDSDIDISSFESVDEIVTKELLEIDSEKFDKNTLLKLYNEI